MTWEQPRNLPDAVIRDWNERKRERPGLIGRNWYMALTQEQLKERAQRNRKEGKTKVLSDSVSDPDSEDEERPKPRRRIITSTSSDYEQQVGDMREEGGNTVEAQVDPPVQENSRAFYSPDSRRLGAGTLILPQAGGPPLAQIKLEARSTEEKGVQVSVGPTMGINHKLHQDRVQAGGGETLRAGHTGPARPLLRFTLGKT
jgi:hypothetical protein